jgi:hypothetical protein
MFCMPTSDATEQHTSFRKIKMTIHDNADTAAGIAHGKK